MSFGTHASHVALQICKFNNETRSYHAWVSGTPSPDCGARKCPQRTFVVVKEETWKKMVILAYGTRIPHQLPVLENVILHPHVSRVACDDVMTFRVLLLYKY